MKKNRAICTSTQTCAIIGNPVEHSLSPAIHNAAFQALGMDYVYLAFKVQDIEKAIRGMRVLENFRGMSITIPHKIEIMKYLDDISDVDRHIGSVNTVINEGGRLLGLGTDGPGALKALKDAGVEPGGRNILILGAGGAARAGTPTKLSEPSRRASSRWPRSGRQACTFSSALRSVSRKGRRRSSAIQRAAITSNAASRALKLTGGSW